MQFKTDFAAAHRELRLTIQTAQQSGFHSANMMIEYDRRETMQGPTGSSPSLHQDTEG
jgi:hypothetical protein